MRRPARVNEHGLVIPPSERDCIGEDCKVAVDEGSCFTDRHHLYFPRSVYVMSALTIAFASNQENIIWMARCTHNRYHKRHKFARIPNSDVMATFLDESRLKQDYASLMKLIDIKLKQVEGEGETVIDRYGNERRISPSSVSRLEDELYELLDRQAEVGQKIPKLELIKADFGDTNIAAALTDLSPEEIAA